MSNEIDRKLFFDTVRAYSGKLKQGQVNGFNFILDAWTASQLKDLRWLAYALATAWLETNASMQPVREAYFLDNPDRDVNGPKAEAYRKKLRYYPYYGRGYVQLTWRTNYEKYGIQDTPDKALDPSTAARIMFKGMTAGSFTGKKFVDYFNQGKEDPYNARRIINRLDRAAKVASYYKIFKKAIGV